MARLRIMWPAAPVAFAGAMQGPQRAFTPDPKEATVASGMLDSSVSLVEAAFSADMMIDTIFVGYVGGVGQQLEFRTGADNGPATVNVVSIAPSDGYLPGHYLLPLPAPIAVKNIQIRLASGQTASAGFSIGVVALGRSIVPTWGYEFGGGRLIEDTSNVSRLFGGGFGIDQGAVTTGFQWTFGDLQPDEVRSLFAMARNIGTSRTILVVEDPDYTAGLSQRIHWGILRKIEAYERIDPLNTRWSFQIGDWS